MVYSREEIKFQSSDGKNTVFGEINLPEGTPRAVIQISHGMIDHIGRYTPLVEYLLGRGFAVAGNDHLGHGKTAASEKDFGYFAKKDGYKLVVDDLKRMNDLLHERFKDIPVFLLGHSMGSFIARWALTEYKDAWDAAVISGTAGPEAPTGAGKLLCRVLGLFGKHNRY